MEDMTQKRSHHLTEELWRGCGCAQAAPELSGATGTAVVPAQSGRRHQWAGQQSVCTRPRAAMCRRHHCHQQLLGHSLTCAQPDGLPVTALLCAGGTTTTWNGGRGSTLACARQACWRVETKPARRRVTPHVAAAAARVPCACRVRLTGSWSGGRGLPWSSEPAKRHAMMLAR